MRAMSLRNAQIALLMGVLLLTATVIGGSAFRSARFAVHDLSHQILDQNSARIAERVDADLGR